MEVSVIKRKIISGVGRLEGVAPKWQQHWDEDRCSLSEMLVEIRDNSSNDF